MNQLLTKYCFFSAILMLAIFVGIGGSFPGQAQAYMELHGPGSDDPGGDPNDEQDINDGGSDGTYDDDYEDGYWGSPEGDWERPIIIIVPSWSWSIPSLKIYIITESRPLPGEIYAR